MNGRGFELARRPQKFEDLGRFPGFCGFSRGNGELSRIAEITVVGAFNNSAVRWARFAGGQLTRPLFHRYFMALLTRWPYLPQTSLFTFWEGFPSGQRDQTVNLTAQPSEVRILPPPPPGKLETTDLRPHIDFGVYWEQNIMARCGILRPTPWFRVPVFRRRV